MTAAPLTATASNGKPDRLSTPGHSQGDKRNPGPAGGRSHPPPASPEDAGGGEGPGNLKARPPDPPGPIAFPAGRGPAGRFDAGTLRVSPIPGQSGRAWERPHTELESRPGPPDPGRSARAVYLCIESTRPPRRGRRTRRARRSRPPPPAHATCSRDSRPDTSSRPGPPSNRPAAGRFDAGTLAILRRTPAGAAPRAGPGKP